MLRSERVSPLESGALDRSAILTKTSEHQGCENPSLTEEYTYINDLENPGIDPGTSRMLSERSTI